MTHGLGLLTGNSNSHAIRSLKHQSASTQITMDTASGMQCPLAILRKQILDISLTIVNSLGVRKKLLGTQKLKIMRAGKKTNSITCGSNYTYIRCSYCQVGATLLLLESALNENCNHPAFPIMSTKASQPKNAWDQEPWFYVYKFFNYVTVQFKSYWSHVHKNIKQHPYH